MESKYIEKTENELDIKALIQVIFNRKKFILFIASIMFSLSLIIAIFSQNIYVSKATLLMSNPEESLSNMLGGYSSLAGFAGVSLLSGSGDKSDEAIERIQSFDFFSNYFLPNIKLEDLMAVSKWDAEKNKLYYRDSKFDETTKKWVRDVDFPKKPRPSSQEAFEIYERILTAEKDNRTNFIYLSIEHKSPFIAKSWLDLIIKNINESMREEDRAQASESINFLNESLQETNLEEMQDAIAELLEMQMQKLMLASSNEDYIFKRIESPIAPEEESRPARFLNVIFGTAFGFFIGIGIVLVQSFRNEIKSK